MQANVPQGSRQTRRSNSRVLQKQDQNVQDAEMTDCSGQEQNWRVPEKHIIHLNPSKVIGSGSFGNHISLF